MLAFAVSRVHEQKIMGRCDTIGHTRQHIPANKPKIGNKKAALGYF
jgi:hypothetical protein